MLCLLICLELIRPGRYAGSDFNPQWSSLPTPLPFLGRLLCALSQFTVAVFPACEGCEKCDTLWQVYGGVTSASSSSFSFAASHIRASMQVQTISISPLSLCPFLSHCCWQFPFKWKLMANKQEEEAAEAAAEGKRNAKRVCRLCGYLFVCCFAHAEHLNLHA